MKDALWRSAFPRWTGEPASVPGYTVLAPVPGDLPAFVHLVLAVTAQQDATGRVETVVVPDYNTPEFETAFLRARSLFDVGSVRLVRFGSRGAACRRFARPGPGMLHFMQIYYGALAVRTTHALLHDADLFVEHPTFFWEHYQECVNRDLACLGVAPVWDEWLRSHDASHVVATWDLMFEIGWLRAFAPWEHRGHFAKWRGERHEFDTMLYTQTQTPAGRCGLSARTEGLLHFNWVFGAYRTFQRMPGGVYEDRRFLILLIRLLHEAYYGESERSQNETGALPTISELARGLSSRPGRISYRFAGAHEQYDEFRNKVKRIIEGGFLAGEQGARLLDELRPFDAAFR